MPKPLELLAALTTGLIVIGALGGCGPSPPAAEPAAAADPGDGATEAPLAEATERHAERLCACPTAACAAAVAAEVSDLLAAHPHRPAGGEARLRTALETMWRCRARLDQPGDPVDMDGAIGEPSSGSASEPGSDSAPAPPSGAAAGGG